MPVRSSQDDFLLRELRKVAEMIARALGFRSRSDLPAARAELERAYALLLGPESALLRAVDVESASRILGHPKKIAALARLASLDAELAADAGRDDEQSRLFARATALAQSAVRLDPSDDDARAVLAELKPQ
jgi:hypothetical protein